MVATLTTQGRSNLLQSELQFTVPLQLYFPSSEVALIHVDSEPSRFCKPTKSGVLGSSFGHRFPSGRCLGHKKVTCLSGGRHLVLRVALVS